MAKTIGAREATHCFARLLKAVEDGREFVVTRHGRPVARIMPLAAPSGHGGVRRLTPMQEHALSRSMKRLRQGWNLGGGKLDRASLYER